VNLMADSRQERRTGIEGWFDEPSSVEVISAAPVVPPRWKQMVSIFLVFFPLSLLANWALLPLIGTWPLVLRVLTTVLLMTPLMTYVLMPAVTRALRPWLTRRR
jgi:antibiotic biosynthesis monooxygenase (ABM) superfamily enzyme